MRITGQSFSNGDLGLPYYSIGIFLIVSSIFTSTLVWADQDVLGVALAPAIQDRQPVNPFSPPAHCEKDKNGQDSVPIVDVSVMEKIYFWTRISSSTSGTIRHSWHQEIKGRWHNLSEVDLPISPSGSYRTWSSKTILPGIHVGNWMVVVAPSDNPDHILCISRFMVE